MHILILLLGGNPLPNYVLLKYLTNPDRDDKDSDQLPVPDYFIFVYSDRTKKSFAALTDKIGIARCNIEEVNLRNHERSKKEIYNGVQNAIKRIFANKQNDRNLSSIHLNFVGGTKPMTVYSLMAVSEWQHDTYQPVKVFSDLDPVNYLILKDENLYPYKDNLLAKVKLTIQDILELHDVEVDPQKAGDEQPSMLPEKLAPVVKTLYEWLDKTKLPEDIGKVMSEYNPYFGKIAKGNKDKPLTEIEKLISQNQVDLVCRKLSHFIPELNSFFTDRTFNFPKLAFSHFINRHWFEDFIQHILIEIKDEPGIQLHEIRRCVQFFYNKRPAEIDIIAMKGYQMFLISCTTSRGLPEVKAKTFEAVYRAEEIGGEHAKVIMISLLPQLSHPTNPHDKNNIYELQQDFQQFRSSANCYFIGREIIEGELLNNQHTLKDELRHIIRGLK